MQLDCDIGSGYNGQYIEARIASIFVLLVLSAAGSFFPLLAVNYKSIRVPVIVIFVTRYFGSGVIVATAFIHLLGESQDSFSHPCVKSVFEGYPWASATSLVGVLVMFSIEAFTHRHVGRKSHKLSGSDQFPVYDQDTDEYLRESKEITTNEGLISVDRVNEESGEVSEEPSKENENSGTSSKQEMVKILMGIYLLEFGIVFHSVFVGLSLAIADEQFPTLFVAISFHQFFEGMGLGARFATAKWPDHLKRIPWYLSAVYSITTSVGIAAGLGVRHLYSENNPSSLVVVGVFDGFCSGLLIYSSLVELMARDFIVDPVVDKISNRRYVLAYLLFLLGVLLMALVGKWA